MREEIFKSVVVTERKQLDEKDMGEIQGLPDALRERIVSRPPEGCFQVFNIYYDPDTEEYVFQREG